MNNFAYLAFLVLGAGPADSVSVSARMDADRLVVGQEYEIELGVSFADGTSASKAGVPAPILQIVVPPSAELVGKVLSTQEELSKNEFLQAPYERLLKDMPAKIRFKLLKQPGPEEEFGLTVVAYTSPGGDEAFFIRRRLVLPFSPRAVARVAEPTISTWSGNDTLHIGDRAVAFNLPKADGSKVSLEQYLGKTNIIVTTYRAHW